MSQTKTATTLLILVAVAWIAGVAQGQAPTVAMPTAAIEETRHA